MTSGQTILICNDELHVVRAIEHRFRSAGFNLICAENTDAARDVLRETPLDIVISDVRLGQSDALKWIEEIRNDRQHSEVAILLLTDKGFELDLDDVCGRLGVLTVIPKPFSPNELLATVKEILQSGSQPSREAFLLGDHPQRRSFV